MDPRPGAPVLRTQRGTFDIVIVPHDMGSPVVRQALKTYPGKENGTRVRWFVSLASSFGGLSSARIGVDHAPLALPAWRDVSAKSPFIRKLFRNSLPESGDHDLIYACRNTRDLHGSDGIVPVYGQLPGQASSKRSGRDGWQATHAGMRQDGACIELVITLIAR